MGKRIECVDIIKGIGIVLVVFGHTIQRNAPNFGWDNYLYRAIALFHMPLFFTLSGFVLYGKEIDYSRIKKGFRRLICPFFLWSIVYYLMKDFYFTGLVPLLHFQTNIGDYLVYDIVHPENGLWYLWVLFLSYIFLFITKKFLRKITLLNAVICILLLQFIPFKVFGLNLFITSYPFILFGYLIRRHMSILWRKKSLIFLLALFFPLFVYISIHLDDNNEYFVRIWGYLTAIAGIALTYGFVLLNKNKQIAVCLQKIGMISLEIYVCHTLFLRCGVGSVKMKIVTTFIFALAASYLLQKR